MNFDSGAARSVELYTGTNPAAGAELSVTVPANEVWQVLSMNAQLVTDGTAANRFVKLTITDGTTTFLTVENPTAHTASLTLNYSWFPGADHNAHVFAAGSISVPLPTPLIVRAGYVISTTTIAIVAGDNWGAPTLQVVKL